MHKTRPQPGHPPRRAPARRVRGITLIELMVGVVIGLLAILVITQVALVYEGQKRSTTSGSDAQVSGALALQALQRDVQAGGYGITSGLAALFTVSGVDASGCSITAKANGSTPTGAPSLLAPVVIENGADGAPDTLHVLASGQRNFALPIALGSNHASTDGVFTLKAGGTGSAPGVNVGNAQGDLMLAISADTTPAACTLFGINVDGMTPLLLGPGGTWADGTPLGTVPAGTPLSEASPAPTGSVAVGRRLGHAGADSGAGVWNKSTPAIAGTLTADRTYLVNLGQPADMVYRSYGVGSNGMTLTEFDFATATQRTATDSYAGIVSIQAVYGKALNNVNQQANQWNTDDPAADTVTGTGNGWSRVMAIRIAIVARSAQYEKTEVTSALPTWRPDPAAAPVEIKVDGNTDWRHYRYKVYETTVPLRNVIWQS